MIMGMIQTKEEKAIVDIIKEMQKTVNSLGATIGELKTKVDGMPTDYVKSDEIGTVLTEYFQEARIYSSTVTAKIPESLTETINGVKKSFEEAKKGIDESIAGIKPRKPLLSITISNRFLQILTAIILFSVSIGLLVFINSPMYLAHQLYTLSTYGDNRNPGACYHDAYTKIKAGKRKEIKAQIRSDELLQKSYREAGAILVPLIGADINVTKIQYGQNSDTLVDYRHIGNDVYWSAYFPADGSIWITDSDKIVFPLDAEKTLTSKKVKWEKMK